MEDAEAVRERFGAEGFFRLRGSTRDNETESTAFLVLQRVTVRGAIETPLCSRFDPRLLSWRCARLPSPHFS
jgi:hypothetical protein